MEVDRDPGADGAVRRRAAARSLIHGLRWTLIGLVLASTLHVAWQASWMTTLSAPGRALGILHSGTSPLWSPPSAITLAEELRTLRASDEWHRVDPAHVTSRVEPMWDRMCADLLLLLVPATLLPGWLYTRVRGRDRDLVLHLGLRGGCGLALGLSMSFALWLVGGGWGPPMLAELGCLGLVLGLVTGVASFAKNTARPGAEAGGPPTVGG
jgi:hypothetical protein